MFNVRCPACAKSFVSESTDAICPACGCVTEVGVAPPSLVESPQGEPRSQPLTGYIAGIALLALAMVPLAVSLFSKDDTEERYQRTLNAHPEVREKFADSETVQLHDVLAEFPGGVVEGAHLSVDTKWHWVYAGAAAVAFLLFALLGMPRGNSTLIHPLGVALFTGTVGIAMLMFFQLIAEASQHIASGNAIVLILRMIGHSYRLAFDPEAGFFMSLAGFTFGVGLCEELLKAVPIYWHFRRTSSLDWRGALLWGVASGIGFGVTEGIFYSADFYNGLAGVETYVTRFVSCVALHSVWSASVALVIWEDQDQIFQAGSFIELAGTVPGVLLIPMVLHALYDTLLKRGPGVLAGVVALASVAWLARRIILARRREERDPALA